MTDNINPTDNTNGDSDATQPAEATTPVVEAPESTEPVEAAPDAKTVEVPESAKIEDVKPEAKEPESVPEKYEAFKLAEGNTMSKGMLDKATELFKDSKFTQEKAQEFMTLAEEYGQEIIKVQQSEWVDVRKGWVNEIKEDKEFGGKNYDATVTKAQSILKKFGDLETGQFLDLTGYGDNPGMIRMLSRIHKALTEDKVVEGLGTEFKPTQAEIMYPNMNK